MYKPDVALIGMVYRSPAYLQHLADELLDAATHANLANAQSFIIYNDATPEVLDASENFIHFHSQIFYNDPRPEDYYLNRVYRAWNVGGRCAAIEGNELLCFVNSDMLFAPGWLDALVRAWQDDPNRIPCSRLVESGKMPSGQHGVSRDFGRHVNRLDREGFYSYAKEISRPEVVDGGLYMPCLISSEDFIRSGGYPEGNIYEGGPGRIDTPFVRSGDDHFFHHNHHMKNRRHVTVFDSVVFHIIEGEKDA